MEPDDLDLLRTPGPPALTVDGAVLVALSVPDLTADRNTSRIVRLRPGDGPPARSTGRAVALTDGPVDTDPVTSPDGRLLIFRRTVDPGASGADGHPQLHALPLDGGEARRLTDHPLGAGVPVFSPDGRRFVYPAAVPEPGRYGTDPDVGADAEPGRRIDRFTYRADGTGFVLDRLPQLFVVELDEESPGAPVRQLTDEPLGVRDPVVGPDSSTVFYVRPTGLDELTDEIATITVDAAPGVGRPVVRAAGSAARPVPHAGGILYYGAAFTRNDAAARTTGLWWAAVGADPVDGRVVRRLTDEETVDLDPAAGMAVPVGDRVLVAALHRGTVSVRAVPFDPDIARTMDDLAEIAGRGRLVRSFAARDGALAVVVADPSSTGEVVLVGTDGREAVLTDFGAELRDRRGVCPLQEIEATAPDGYPVHGFLVLPPGPGPHPVLVVVHGGPHAAYSAAFFDEAQVYASAGYAVVLGNPRGSAGYGQAHARAVLHRLGTVDADDLLALLDVVRARPDCAADRVGVMGGSYGGFMTSWLLGHAADRFVAGISERAVNAWDSFAGSSDIGWYFTDTYVGAERDTQWAASPLAAADAIDRPLLIVHSEHDWRCPVEQAQRLFVSLRRRGVPVEMVLFPGEGHELSRSGRPRHRRQRFEVILDWWGRHLPAR
ncbi:S9 family peptidase [Nakamurella flava]|uniref:S9 family peptidase n=1 Tax=Nakamurella flava TaxID=2576308 RepID=A0A4V6CSF7_9ACTN|nr:S9 family peptidase [Nakamurella flava]TKV61275.1 S9 family peptidase [Nakamurella flava]